MSANLEELVRRNKMLLTELEQHLGYRFTDLRLLQQALIHASFAFEQSGLGSDNEILEFLGDAVLDLAVGHALCQRYPELQEGQLTRLRASLVNETHLAAMARALGLGRFLCLGRGEDASKGRDKPSILSGAFEAVVGAVFEDGGYRVAADLAGALFAESISDKKSALQVADAKSRLQETLQEKFNQAPLYRLDDEEGPSHRKLFRVSVCFRSRVLGRGAAGSKKLAEQRAAAAALEQLDQVLLEWRQ